MREKHSLQVAEGCRDPSYRAPSSTHSTPGAAPAWASVGTGRAGLTKTDQTRQLSRQLSGTPRGSTHLRLWVAGEEDLEAAVEQEPLHLIGAHLQVNGMVNSIQSSSRVEQCVSALQMASVEKHQQLQHRTAAHPHGQAKQAVLTMQQATESERVQASSKAERKLAPARRRHRTPPAAAPVRLRTGHDAHKSVHASIQSSLGSVSSWQSQQQPAGRGRRSTANRSPASCSLAAACRPATPAPTTTTSACPCCAAALQVADRAAERCCGLLAGVKGRRCNLAAGQRARGVATEGWAAAAAANIVRSGNGWPLLGMCASCC